MGVGNLLLRDEGVGIHVIRTLEKLETLPGHVELIDAGTSALDALQAVGESDRLIVIDAIRGGGAPGAIYRFKPADIHTANWATVSLHQLGFIEALSIAERLGNAPRDVTIIGIEPNETTPGLELSGEIAQRMPYVIELVIRLIEESSTL